MKKGNIFIITGTSGSGKTVISEYILKHRQNTVRAVSVTTRQPRPNEIDKMDYFFVSQEEFQNMIKENKLIEYANVYGNLYGTTIESFNKINENKDVVKVIDVQGALKIKELNIKHTSFFFHPLDRALLIKRLEERKELDINKRIVESDKELKHKNKFDYFIDTSGDESAIEKNALKVIEIMNSIK